MIKSLRQRMDTVIDLAIIVVLIGLFVLAVFGSRASHAASANVDWFAWWDGFLQNSGTEMLGAFLTFILLEVIRGRREKRIQDELEETRTKATQDMIRSFVQAQEIARLRAAQTPKERMPILSSMKATGLLEGADLYNTDLAKANLLDANLTGTDLNHANLTGAHLVFANLTGARLSDANLTGAYLLNANLGGASLERAKLMRADLTGAYMDDTNLRRVELEGAVLPDGTELPGRTGEEQKRGMPEPDWRTPFAAWDRAGRPRVEARFLG